jgi:hypothetical protein
LPSFRRRFGRVLEEDVGARHRICVSREYSMFRGPISLWKWRLLHIAADRDVGDMYGFILEGGYRQFWYKHKGYCIGRYLTEHGDVMSDWEIQQRQVRGLL